MSGPALLATKLHPPVRRGLMHRRRLVQALDGAARHQLTLLIAPSLHLVLATRSEPPLPFGRLRAHGELLEIRAADLAFTDTEAATMLNGGALALGLEVGDVERLSRRTEGWAAGLYLAGLSLREHTDRAAFLDKFAGTDRFVRSARPRPRGASAMQWS